MFFSFKDQLLFVIWLELLFCVSRGMHNRSYSNKVFGASVMQMNFYCFHSMPRLPFCICHSLQEEFCCVFLKNQMLKRANDVSQVTSHDITFCFLACRSVPEHLFKGHKIFILFIAVNSWANILFCVSTHCIIKLSQYQCYPEYFSMALTHAHIK